MKNNIVSIYEVTDCISGKKERVFIEGDGQACIRHLRKSYYFLTRFVLEGFEINGTFVQLKTGR